ncbi:unnamed protein product [Effrenium voratum]|nr:unnamed protein product [Effrenium voratum]
MNMGGLLKNSESLLVMWDSTYAERLWCVFELAAYLKSHEDSSCKLMVRPVLLGPLTLITFFVVTLRSCILVAGFPVVSKDVLAGLSAVAALLAVCALQVQKLRGYNRSMEALQHQLSSFSFAQTKSYCCSANHKDDNGAPFRCDREILLECITLWFGSVESFEQCVQSKVSASLLSGLGSHALPYSWILAASSPFLWAAADSAASLFRCGEWRIGLPYLLNGLAWWLAANPALFVVCGLVSHRLRARADRQCVDLLKSIVGAVFIIILALLAVAAQQACFTLVDDELHAALAFSGGMTLLAGITWRKCKPS